MSPFLLAPLLKNKLTNSPFFGGVDNSGCQQFSCIAGIYANKLHFHCAFLDCERLAQEELLKARPILCPADDILDLVSPRTFCDLGTARSLPRAHLENLFLVLQLLRHSTDRRSPCPCCCPANDTDDVTDGLRAPR